MKHLPMIGLIGATLVSGCAPVDSDNEVDTYIEELKRYVIIATSGHSDSNGGLSKNDIFVQDQGDTVVVMLLNKAPIDQVPIGGRFGIVYSVSKKTGAVEMRIVE